MELSDGDMIAYAASAAVALSVGLVAWWRREAARVARPISFVTFAAAVAAGFMAAQVAAPGMARAFGLVTLVASSLVAAGFYCEVRTLVDPDWRVAVRTAAWLGVHPVSVLALAGINPGHLFAAGTVVGGLPPLAAPPGPLLWADVAYEYALAGWCLHLLARTMIDSSSPLERRQLRSLILSAGLPLAAGGINLAQRHLGQVVLDLTPLAIGLTGLVHYYAVFRQGLLRLLPIARDLVVEHVKDAIFVLDAYDRVVDVNPASRLLAARLGWRRPEHLLGAYAWALLPEGVDRQEVIDGEHHLHLPGGPLDLDLRVSEVLDQHGSPLGRVIVARDVTEVSDQRRQVSEQLYVIDSLRQELAEQAIRDDLTGLHNRRHLIRRLEDGLEQARSAVRPFSLVMLDVDHLKGINERHDHAVGDALLIAISSALLHGVREDQTLARFGGEEFVLLLPGIGMDDALEIAESLRVRCATVQVGGHRGPVTTTVSGGVVTYPTCGWTGSELLRNAGAALYAAKRAGRDRVVCGPGL
jgi:diguanylate cyclase (GGDEF)-like protein